jgi:hypothetical protein
VWCGDWSVPKENRRADQADFDLRVAVADGDHGCHAPGDETNMFDRHSRALQVLPERQRRFPQVGREQGAVGRRHAGEQAVCIGLPRGGGPDSCRCFVDRWRRSPHRRPVLLLFR